MPIVCTSLDIPQSAASPSFRIQEPCLLLVEGNDDQRVFEQLAIQHPLLSLQIIDMHGNSDWTAKVAGLASAPEFQSVTVLGLVRDADSLPISATDSIRGALLNSALPTPPSELVPATNGRLTTIFLILPDDGRAGKLETIVLESLPDDQRTCLEEYFACHDRLSARTRDEEKARLQAWLAALDGPCRNIAMAAARQKLSLASPAFDRCRALVRYFQ